MNLFTFANEMTNPKMLLFMNEILNLGHEEMNEKSDFFGTYIKIYNDITIKRKHDMDWFFKYDCELDELGYGNLSIFRDTYCNIENEFHLAVNNECVASGSALWVLMHLYDIVSQDVKVCK